MQTRFTTGLIDIINGIVNHRDQRIQAAVGAIHNSNLLYNATHNELTIAIRDNRNETNSIIPNQPIIFNV